MFLVVTSNQRNYVPEVKTEETASAFLMIQQNYPSGEILKSKLCKRGCWRVIKAPKGVRLVNPNLYSNSKETEQERWSKYLDWLFWSAYREKE